MQNVHFSLFQLFVRVSTLSPPDSQQTVSVRHFKQTTGFCQPSIVRKQAAEHSEALSSYRARSLPQELVENKKIVGGSEFCTYSKR